MLKKKNNTMLQKTLHPRDNTSRLYIKQDRGEKGFINIKLYVQTNKMGFSKYAQENCRRIGQLLANDKRATKGWNIEEYNKKGKMEKR